MLNNKNDIMILEQLYINNKNDKFESYSIKELTNVLNNQLSSMKVRQTLNTFLEQGLVDLGFKSGRSNTYFITQKGITTLRNILGDEFYIPNIESRQFTKEREIDDFFNKYMR